MTDDDKTRRRGLRIITKEELREMVPYTSQHIQRLENEGKFPRRVKLGDNRVGWVLSEVEEWLEVRMAARPRVTPAERQEGRPTPASDGITRRAPGSKPPAA